MPHDLIVRPEAETELTDAYSWYEEKVQGLGDHFLLSVDAILQAITRGPQQYPKVFKTIRRAILPRFPYAIFFVESESRVTVLAIFHAKRDPRKWRNRK